MKIVLASTVIAAIGAAMISSAVAGPAESNTAKVRAHWATLHTDGGYGNPLTQVPAAMIEMVGKAMQAETRDGARSADEAVIKSQPTAEAKTQPATN